jgi:hypothetical protein
MPAQGHVQLIGADLHQLDHVGQVFVDPQHPSRITGVLDIDTAGLGDPADDAAAFYAHLVVTAQHHRSRGDDDLAEKCLSLAGSARERWSGRADDEFAVRARAIAATHLLGHILTAGGYGAVLLSAAEDLVEELLDDLNAGPIPVGPGPR